MKVNTAGTITLAVEGTEYEDDCEVALDWEKDGSTS